MNLIIIILVLQFYVILDLFIYQRFYEHYAEFSVYIQRYDSHVILIIMKILSNGCILAMGVICLFAMWRHPQRLRVLCFRFYFILCAFMMISIKLIYSNPRPCMSYAEINCWECL